MDYQEMNSLLYQNDFGMDFQNFIDFNEVNESENIKTNIKDNINKNIYKISSSGYDVMKKYLNT